MLKRIIIGLTMALMGASVLAAGMPAPKCVPKGLGGTGIGWEFGSNSKGHWTTFYCPENGQFYWYVVTHEAYSVKTMVSLMYALGRSDRVAGVKKIVDKTIALPLSDPKIAAVLPYPLIFGTATGWPEPAPKMR